MRSLADEVPFDIPDSWEWVRISSISKVVTKGTSPRGGNVPVCTRFFYYLFYLYKGAGWIGGKGIAIQGLSSNAIHNLLFPLPPLHEQELIVNAIDTALDIVQKL